MTNLYFRTGMTCAFAGMAFAAFAGITPKVKPETPVEGVKYVLVNKAQSSTQYMSRTGWDGALYFLGETDSNYANHAMQAQKNADGTWSFYLPQTTDVTDPETGEATGETQTVNYYLGIPGGTANANLKSTEVIKWRLDEKENGFYNLILDEGNNADALAQAPFTPTKDIRLHLNNGAQYFVATFPGETWFPDCYGGISQTEDGDNGDVYFSANDSTSFNWGFVSLDKLSAYMEDFKVVKLISAFETDYADIDEYAEGFKLTLDAVTAIYNADNFNENEEDINTISEMINAKVELYKEIQNALILNDTDDAILASAIDNATDLFTKTTAVTDLATALSDLKQAETNYSLGNGDVTPLGTNMSFEDLTAQEGNTTTGVAAPPTGWNIYINGNKVTTVDEVKAAGITAWHGVNADCAGDVKDGNYGFGVWNSSIPTYELSQTISGLDNGTYIVRAGLMVGANGNGSRRTTQRIFANLSSTYFGAEEDYNLSKLDNSEVYGFAYLSEPTTDTEMQEVSVRAYVYDGTLTFGLRTDGNIAAANRESSNPNGGDGWFKTDNYTIEKVGYVADDAYNTFSHYFSILADYLSVNKKMASDVKAQLSSSYDNLSAISKNSSEEDIVSAILNAKSILATVDESVKAYESFKEAIDMHAELTADYSNKKGIDDYTDAIYEAESVYDDGSAQTTEEVEAEIAKLDAALQACKQSDDIEEGDLLTDYIQNPSFEDLSAQNGSNSSGVAATPKGWDMYINGTKVSTAAEINAQGVTGWCAINEGDGINVTLEDGTVVTNQYSDGSHLWGIWNGTIPEIELSQVVSGLPAGTYTLTCDVLVQYNWAGNCLTTQRIFANDYVAMYSSEDAYENNLPDDAKVAAEIDELNADAEVKHLNYAGFICESPRSDYSNTVSLTFGLAEAGEATIGFRTNNITSDGTAAGNGLGWFKLDNWTLTYDSKEVPAGAETRAEATAVNDITDSQAKTAVDFYTADGARLNAPRKGLNIMRMSDGTVSKVFIK